MPLLLSYIPAFYRGWVLPGSNFSCKLETSSGQGSHVSNFNILIFEAEQSLAYSWPSIIIYQFLCHGYSGNYSRARGVIPAPNLASWLETVNSEIIPFCMKRWRRPVNAKRIWKSRKGKGWVKAIGGCLALQKGLDKEEQGFPSRRVKSKNINGEMRRGCTFPVWI